MPHQADAGKPCTGLAASSFVDPAWEGCKGAGLLLALGLLALTAWGLADRFAIPLKVAVAALLIPMLLLLPLLLGGSSGWAGRVSPLPWAEQVILLTGGGCSWSCDALVIKPCLMQAAQTTHGPTPSASSGIGRELAHRLRALRPKCLVLVDCQPPCPELLALHAALGGETQLLVPDPAVCDLADEEQVRAMMAWVLAHVPAPPSLLINNAGIISGGLFVDLDWEQIRRTMQVNSLAPMLMAKLTLPAMLDSGRAGCIVNVASILGATSASFVTDYCASKAAVIAWHEGLRQEFNSLRPACLVRLVLVTPGLVGTDLFAGVRHRYPWLTPTLPPGHVAERILAAVEAGRHVDLTLPFYTHFVPLLRLLPPRWNDWVHERSGANEEMRGFRGAPVGGTRNP